MKKYFVFITLILGFYLCFLTGIKFINAQEGAKETVTLESSMGNVTLSHQKHTGLTECKECHHSGMDVPKCSQCHNKDASVNAQNAFHKKCIDCHKTKSAGPTGCMDCHKK